MAYNKAKKRDKNIVGLVRVLGRMTFSEHPADLPCTRCVFLTCRDGRRGVCPLRDGCWEETDQGIRFRMFW